MCHVLVIEDDPIAALDIHSILKGPARHPSVSPTLKGEAVQSARDEIPRVIVSDVMLSRGTVLRR